MISPGTRTEFKFIVTGRSTKFHKLFEKSSSLLNRKSMQRIKHKGYKFMFGCISFHSKLKCYLFKNSYSDSFDPPFSHSLTLNYTCFNSYSVSSDPLEIGPELIRTPLRKPL